LFEWTDVEGPPDGAQAAKALRKTCAQRYGVAAHPWPVRLNLLLLLVVVFVPFPTGLVANALHNSSGERVYVTMYGLTLLAIRLLGSALDAYARHEHLYSPKGEGEELHSTQRKFLPVVIGYVLAVLIGLALPVAAVAIYFGIAVYLVVPFREAARVLRRRHSSR
jgi:TMEM175 potassium channel family protein